MKENIRQVIDLAKEFKAQSLSLLDGAPGLAANVTHVMDRLMGGLAHAGGVMVDSNQEQAKPERLTHIAGAPIRRTLDTIITPGNINPTEAEIKQVQDEATEAFEAFQTMKAPQIRESYGDMTIRVVASKAGMPDIGPTQPKTINIPFIEKVIAAVLVKAEEIRQDQLATGSATSAKEKAAEEEVNNTTADPKTKAIPDVIATEKIVTPEAAKDAKQ